MAKKLSRKTDAASQGAHSSGIIGSRGSSGNCSVLQWSSPHTVLHIEYLIIISLYYLLSNEKRIHGKYDRRGNKSCGRDPTMGESAKNLIP